MKTGYFLLFGILFCLTGRAQMMEQISINSNGISRDFFLKLPADESVLDHNLPVIIGMHGDGGNGSSFGTSSGVAGLAETKGFIGVFPNAVAGGWNRAVQGQSPADDVKFIEDIIDYLCTNYFINRNRVYAMGHSAGGFMSYRLAIEKANKIAAISSVAGNLYGDANNNGNAFMTNYLSGSNFIKIPILHIHGDADGVVSYPDPNHQPDAWNEFPLTGFSYPTCGVDTYSAANVTDINAHVKKIPYCVGSAANKEITLIRIVGGGHEWPSTKLPDVATRIVDFLLAQSIVGQSSCSDLNIETVEKIQFSIVPNPVLNYFTIDASFEIENIQVIDASGRIVLENKYENNRVNCESLKTGLYTLKVFSGEGISSAKFVKY